MTQPDETPAPEILPLGADGLLVRFSTRLDDAANRAVLGFADYLDEAMPEGVVEMSTTLSSAYLRFDPDRTDRTRLAARLKALLGQTDWLSLPEEAPKRRWHIPVVFGGEDGPQLADTAALLGMREERAVADLLAHPVRVLAIGFAPGQPYLGMLPERWDIPRLQEINPQVPAGALVVAVRQLIVFANASPTGWRQVGRSAFKPYRAGAAEPFPLLPGDVLQFAQVSAEEFDRIERGNADGFGGARLEITE
ncbi:carboxyltransferase domain-containing protein [Alisedimentitalea sp. MJ-SS2]|uniref:5-oxoprolinase subunit B family protein n=1 Tax=Aliisedimentitalea sp. MJ-SS2 TaxID=3049795 RepID=UPI00291102ED|nr:carboxyltransferase domain-containing protein [Alisedimentitalea sp. MJ-SS2]MDU8928014.1 carboxyltransferase domain-containing protein [Alisedimentitalea sp. MJ-SS2]